MTGTGCGAQIFFNNAPVPAGTVRFVPAQGEPVSADLGPDGTYRATGVPVGPARVAVETLRFKGMTPPPAGMAKMMGGPKRHYTAIPNKYEKPETANLSVEVTEGKQEWNLSLE